MKKKLLALCIGATLLATNSFAELSNKDMMSKLKKENPNLAVDEVTYLPEVKLYEVIIKGNPTLTYTNENMDFFLAAGQIINPKNKTSISADREEANVKRFYKNLPFNTAIKVQYGKGTRTIAVFTDPDCPYCKSTDQEIHKKLNKSDLTVYYFMNPLNIPGHEQAPLKARKIYCSPNRAKAWTDWMLNNQLPNNDGSCKTPLDEHKRIANSVNFNSTPTILFDNGYVVRTALTAEQITDVLSKKPAN